MTISMKVRMFIFKRVILLNLELGATATFGSTLRISTQKLENLHQVEINTIDSPGKVYS